MVGVLPHFEEPAKPRRIIFLRVLLEVSRLVEEGTEEGAVVHKSVFSSTFHVWASHEGGCRVLSNPS